MKRYHVKFAVISALMVTLCLLASGVSLAEPAASPVERLVSMEVILYGAPQEGSIVSRLENIELLVFGETGSGTLPDRLSQCWNFVQGDRAGGMNLKFKLKAVQWMMFGKVSEGPIAPTLSDIESKILGKPGTGSIGVRLDNLLRLTIPSGRPEVGYALVPKGVLIKVRMLNPVSSLKSRPGDVIKFEVAQDVVSEGKLVLPAGSSVVAKVMDTVRPTKLGVRARVDLELGYVDGMDSSPIACGVDQAAIASNTSVAMVAGDGIRRFGLLGKEGALGGVLTQNEELEVPEGTEVFISVMQTAKVLGLAVSDSK